MTTRPTGGVGTSGRSTSTAGEIETSRPQVIRAKSVSTLVKRYPPERHTSYLAYRKRTNVTTKGKGTHPITPSGVSNTTETDATTTTPSPLQLGLIPARREYTRDEPSGWNIEKCTPSESTPPKTQPGKHHRSVHTQAMDGTDKAAVSAPMSISCNTGDTMLRGQEVTE